MEPEFFDKKKKIWLAVIGGSLVVIIALIVLFATGTIGNSPDSADPNGDPTATDDGGKSPSGGIDYQLPEQEVNKDQLEQVYIGKVSSNYGGVVKSFSETGSLGEITIEVGGANSGVIRKFAMNTDSKVFDVNKNLVVLPSTLAQLPKETKVRLVVAGSEQDDQIVEAVLINEKDYTYYSHISEIVEEGKYVHFINNESAMQYRFSTETPVINALTGLPYDLEKVKVSDRLFIYADSDVVVEPLKIEDTPSEDKSKSTTEDKTGVEKGYTKFNDYTRVEAKQVFVYPK